MASRPLRVCLAPNSRFNFLPPFPKLNSKCNNEIALCNLGRTARPVNDVQHRKCSPHWYKFQALFKGLHDTKLNEIIGYRLFTPPNGKKSEYDRDMEKLKRAWALPKKDDGKEDAALIRFEALLYGEAAAQKNYKDKENG